VNSLQSHKLLVRLCDHPHIDASFFKGPRDETYYVYFDKKYGLLLRRSLMEQFSMDLAPPLTSKVSELERILHKDTNLSTLKPAFRRLVKTLNWKKKLVEMRVTCVTLWSALKAGTMRRVLCFKGAITCSDTMQASR
jgi:hypothetical protein